MLRHPVIKRKLFNSVLSVNTKILYHLHTVLPTPANYHTVLSRNTINSLIMFCTLWVSYFSAVLQRWYSRTLTELQNGEEKCFKHNFLHSVDIVTVIRGFQHFYFKAQKIMIKDKYAH
jgi:hypothetical protein